MKPLALDYLTAVPDRPYPGLRPFRRSDALVFFGREELIEDVVEKLAENHFLAMVGESGAGKSSLVFAGLIPALNSGFIDAEGTDWLVLTMQPGQDPIAAAAEAFVSDSETRAVIGLESDWSDETAQKRISLRLSENPFALSDMLRQVKDQLKRPIIFVVDQFEEIFRYKQRPDPVAPFKFVSNILETIRLREQGVFLVLTMRSDYLGECARFPGLAEALTASQFLTPRLRRQQQRDAIVKPLIHYGAEIEPHLVEALLNESVKSEKERLDPTEEGKDKLPLLQHALGQLWTDSKRDGRDKSEKITLTHAQFLEIAGGKGYKSTIGDKKVPSQAGEGPLQSILKWHLEEVFARVTDEHSAEILFRSLTNRDRGRDDSRREVSAVEVADIVGGQPQGVMEVVELFREDGSNFLQPDIADCPKLLTTTAIDIVHESIIRRWPRLQQWADQEQVRVAEYSGLVRDSKRWAESGKLPADTMSPGLFKKYINWPTNRKLSHAWVSLRQDESQLMKPPELEEPTPRASWEEDFDRVLEYITASGRVLKIERRRDRLVALTVPAVGGLVLFGVLLLKSLAKIDDQTGKLKALQAEANTAQLALSSARANANAAQGNLRTALGELKKVENTMTAVDMRLTETENKRHQAEINYREAQVKLRNFDQRLRFANEGVKVAEEKVKSAEGKVRSLSYQLKTNEMQLKDQAVSLSLAKAALAKASEDLKAKSAERNQLLAQVNTLEKEVDLANAKIAAANEAQKALQNLRAKLQEVLDTLPADSVRAKHAVLDALAQINTGKSPLGTYEVKLGGSLKQSTIRVASSSSSPEFELKGSEGTTDAQFSANEKYLVVTTATYGAGGLAVEADNTQRMLRNTLLSTGITNYHGAFSNWTSNEQSSASPARGNLANGKFGVKLYLLSDKLDGTIEPVWAQEFPKPISKVIVSRNGTVAVLLADGEVDVRSDVPGQPLSKRAGDPTFPATSILFGDDAGSKLYLDDGNGRSETWYLSTAEIPLKVTTSLVDDTIAKELFGETIKKNYFVLKMSFVNSSSGGILVYGDSLAFKVQLEKRLDKGSHNSKAPLEDAQGAPRPQQEQSDLKSGDWTPVTDRDFPKSDYGTAQIGLVITNENGQFVSWVIPHPARTIVAMEKDASAANKLALMSSCLQQYEVLPFGESLQRNAFLPRGALAGVINGFEVRIRSIGLSPSVKSSFSLLDRSQILDTSLLEKR